VKYIHLFPLFLLSFLGSFALASYRPILPVYVRILGGGGLLVGLLSSSFMLARALSASLFGRLSDLLDRRVRFIRIGIILFILTASLFLFANHYPLILILVTLQGFISGMVWPQAQTLIAQKTPQNYRSRAFSIYSISGNIGILLSNGAVGLGLSILAKRGIEEPHSYKYIFASIALLYLITFLTSFNLKESKEEKPREEMKFSLPSLLVVVLCNGVIMGLFRSILLLYIHDRFGFSSRGIAYILFLSQIGGLLPIYMVSHISDIRGLRWGLFITQLPLSVACILIPWLSSPLGVIIAMFFIGMGIRAFIPISRSLVSVGKGVGTRIGLMNSALNIGAVIGPLLGGLVYDIVGIGRPTLALAIFPLAGVGILLALSLITRGR